MKYKKIKPERYRGYIVHFEKMHRGFVGAFVPSRSSQYIGIGKGKNRAFDDAKKSMDNFIPRRKRRK